MIRKILLNISSGTGPNLCLFKYPSSKTYSPTYANTMFYGKWGDSFYEYQKMLNKKNNFEYDVENELWCTQRGSEVTHNPRVRPLAQSENKKSENKSCTENGQNVYNDRED